MAETLGELRYEFVQRVWRTRVWRREFGDASLANASMSNAKVEIAILCAHEKTRFGWRRAKAGLSLICW
ncbi:hypothetical protein K227x_06520 [Rubripirellula lacrimiformis]|uniref:Uncharacterized protein n=1 Tax=Rubripirellula lacrimiformis TaxID=1930273 RepID=A0A517N565_9BACT|nr:hypothetical protein K227x_06520 [Rubripirellula lacrimiformis]